MPNTKFDSKSFNPEAFRYMVGRVPNLHMNEIKRSRTLAGSSDIKVTLGGSQGGTGSLTPEQRLTTFINHLLSYGKFEFSAFRRFRW